MLSRRALLHWGLGSAVFTVIASACSSSGGSRSVAPEPEAADGDLPARFSRFEAADELNGDLSNVQWPSFVTDGDPEIQRLYEFQITHGEVMRYMPCFCGCGQSAGHRSNRDCYVQSVAADGSVVLDSMAPT